MSTHQMIRVLRFACALAIVCSLSFAGWRVSARKHTALAMPPPLSGTKTVCSSGCDYASLTAAVADIQVQGLGGALVLELGATYVSTGETFPLTIPALNGASAVNTLTIRPASGATGLSISSADTTAATVDLNGAQFVTIDGRPGGVGRAMPGAAAARLRSSPSRTPAPAAWRCASSMRPAATPSATPRSGARTPAPAAARSSSAPPRGRMATTTTRSTIATSATARALRPMASTRSAPRAPRRRTTAATPSPTATSSISMRLRCRGND